MRRFVLSHGRITDLIGCDVPLFESESKKAAKIYLKQVSPYFTKSNLRILKHPRELVETFVNLEICIAVDIS